MELKKVCTEADDDSTASLDDRFTEPIDSEKATINRCASILYQLFYLRLSTEKKMERKRIALVVATRMCSLPNCTEMMFFIINVLSPTYLCLMYTMLFNNLVRRISQVHCFTVNRQQISYTVISFLPSPQKNLRNRSWN